MGNAVGLLEVLGFSVAMTAMDQACKTADVEIQAMDCNNPSSGNHAKIPVVVQVKFTGNVSDVKIALETARHTAKQYIEEQDIVTSFIPNQAPGLEKLLGIGKVTRP
ncbi:BMC domain-containing protein [Gracilibacillus kekensis]|uniref:BMC domain-containing protein n=1 Tax=Gracilibacillus kekensis TaxID=1027249 RepID=A0A1M7QVB9_9BACI|nr:BMC domain-containing protein [Gracilibacillus kekensis]SHN35829.1 BMC domain-containing protein [Gracilibacillus kekensis]